MQVHKLRKELDTSSGVSYTALDREILISSGSWTDVGKTALSVYDTTLRKTLQKQVFPISRGIQYWQSVKNSGVWGIALCWLQNFPHFLTQELNPHNFNVSKLKPANFAKHGWKSIFYALKAVSSFLQAPVLKLADENLQMLQQQHTQATETIGNLLQCWDLKGSLEDTISKGVDGMVSALALEAPQQAPQQTHDEPSQTPQAPSETQQVLAKLQQVLDFVNSQAKHSSFVPAWYIRWWPTVLVGTISLGLVLKSWREIAAWFTNSVLDTARSFLYNWVYEPLYQIYLTMRQDPTSRVALMGKESLEADVDSLERMVIEFAKDHNASDMSVDQLKQAVEAGDLGPVMRVYEKEIETPVRSLLTGKLIRSLLIQLQKTKVDAEIAVSGISQLIQSQQLVFGIIAALPALAFVYLSSTGIVSYANGTNDIQGLLQNQGATKDEIMIRLGSIEEIALDNDTLATRNVGQVYCIIAELREFTAKSLSRERHAQFCKDLDRIISLTDGKEIVRILMRIYTKY